MQSWACWPPPFAKTALAPLPRACQASIVGNMKQHGLLEGAEQTTYIEYGAGKGYLWCAAHTALPVL